MDGSSSAHPVDSPWSRSPEDVLKALEVSPESGLGCSEAERRRKKYGSNRVRGAKSKSAWAVLADQFTAQLWHVLSMRDRGSGLRRNDITQNLYVWAALGLCAGLLVAAVCLPGLTDVLRTSALGLRDWVLVLGMRLVPLAIGQVLKDTMGIGL